MAARKFEPSIGSTLATLAMLAVLVWLGTWQVQRLHWKTDLLARIDAQMAATPAPLPEKITDPDGWEYRRVSVTGSFDYTHEFLVQPRTQDGKTGYHMVVPFRRVSGGEVLVNRGWISDDTMKKALRPAGTLKLEGVLQIPQKSYFTPDNAPAQKQWYWIDTAAMAKAAKIAAVPPLVMTVPPQKAGVYPAGYKLAANIPNDHKQYAIFWYGMTIVLLAIYFLSGLKKPQQPEDKHANV